MLRAINPDVVIRRTMKQKSKRHKYFAEESSWVLTAIKKYRNKVERGEKFNG